jgi:two-component system chemotaxis sensor kinase CheA
MDDLVKDFLQESTENLDRLDQEFVQLESDPGNLELLGSIFRTIHTIKGSCGFLGFTKLEKLTHAGENLLSQMRAGELALNQEIADHLLEMVDAVRGVLQEIRTTESEGAEDYLDLIERLKKFLVKGSSPGTKGVSAQIESARAETKPDSSFTSAPSPENEIKKNEIAAAQSQSSEAQDHTETAASSSNAEASRQKKIGKSVVVPGRIGGILVRQGRVRPEEIIRALQMQEAGDPRRLGEILVQLGLITERDITEVLADKRTPDSSEAAIRVDVNLLEKQMNLVSELVLLRNRLLQIATETNERNLNAAVHGLNYVTSELRKNVMKTRMQPISQLFDKLPRIVRDVSKDLGKKIKLETQGGDTELDKTLLEAIKDPVMHILRNSMDHGVEAPQVRSQKGKPEEGTIRIRAFHEGGNFHLEITDDGAGIDPDRVKQKALGKGLITSAQAEKMAETDLLNLIFLPGLSTAEKVTNVSGRGVGMDVVKTNVERIGGLTKLKSDRNRGTTVWLEIPLTLATIPALTVISGKSVFAIPQAALVEMIAVDADDVHKFIEKIDGVSIFRFRGTVLPLMSLAEELKIQGSVSSGISKIVVVRTEGRQIALLVDAIRNTEEIVIKPLDKRFKTVALYSGAAVLGDGRVALILDIAAFAHRAGVVSARREDSAATADSQPRERLTLLLLSGSDGERLAVPLDFVQRLEEFSPSDKELMGGLDVVQYRNEILRMVRLEDLLENRRARPRNPQNPYASAPAEKISAIVVRSKGPRNVILEVTRILGIVKVEIDQMTPPSRPCVRGSLVIQDRVTELLDMPALLAKSQAVQLDSPLLVPSGTEAHHVS